MWRFSDFTTIKASWPACLPGTNLLISLPPLICLPVSLCTHYTALPGYTEGLCCLLDRVHTWSSVAVSVSEFIYQESVYYYANDRH